MNTRIQTGPLLLTALLWGLAVASSPAPEQPPVASQRIYYVWYDVELSDGRYAAWMRTHPNRPATAQECSADIATREWGMENHTVLGQVMKFNDGNPARVLDRYCADRRRVHRFSVPATKADPIKDRGVPADVTSGGPEYVVWYNHLLGDRGGTEIVDRLDEPKTNTQVDCETWRLKYAKAKIKSPITAQVRVDGLWSEYEGTLQKTWCAPRIAMPNGWPQPDTLMPWVTLRQDNGEVWKLPYLMPLHEYQSSDECRSQHDYDESVRHILNTKVAMLGHTGTIVERICERAGAALPLRVK